MECGDLSPLRPRRQKESGDKSPHSKRAVIVHLHWIVTRVRRTASSRHV